MTVALAEKYGGATGGAAASRVKGVVDDELVDALRVLTTDPADVATGPATAPSLADGAFAEHLHLLARDLRVEAYFAA